MKRGDWIPVDKRLINLLPKDRKYSYIEAMISFSTDIDNKKRWTVKGYAELWKWSRNKVRRFTRTLLNGEDYLIGTRRDTIRTPIRTLSRHPIRLIFNNLQNDKDPHKDTHKDTPVTPTKDPDPLDPDPTSKKHIGDSQKTDISPDVKIFIDYAFETFKNKTGEKMLIDGKKDGTLVKKLLETYNLEKLKEFWDMFMQIDDPFIRQAGRSIGVFKTQINKLISSKPSKDAEGQPTEWSEVREEHYIPPEHEKYDFEKVKKVREIVADLERKIGDY